MVRVRLLHQWLLFSYYMSEIISRTLAEKIICYEIQDPCEDQCHVQVQGHFKGQSHFDLKVKCFAGNTFVNRLAVP